MQCAGAGELVCQPPVSACGLSTLRVQVPRHIFEGSPLGVLRLLPSLSLAPLSFLSSWCSLLPRSAVLDPATAWPVLGMLHSLVVAPLLFWALVGYVSASLTIYGPAGAERPSGTASSSGSGPVSTGTLANTQWITALNAYNDVNLQAPALPNPMPSTSFAIGVANNAAGMSGLSIPQKGNFYGFSIEMSVVEQVREYLYFASLVAYTL